MAVARDLAQDHVAGAVVRVLGDVAGGVDATGRHAGLGQLGQHLVAGALQRPGLDRGVDLGHPLHPPGVVGQRRVLGQVGAADGAHQALEDAVAVAGDQHHGVVGAAVGVARRDPRQRAAGGPAHRAEGAVLGDQALHHVEHGLVQRDVDHLAAPAVGLAVVQRGQHADGAVQRGQRVTDADAAAHRHAPGLAGEVAQAAHGLADRAEAGQVAVGPGLPVAADAQHDQARVVARELLVGHAPALERAGAEVLDQHVGLGDQAPGDVLALGAAQVERDRALVAALHLPPHRGAVLHEAPVAQRVAGARGLDLDDVGAEVAERLAGEGAGDQLPHLDDLEPGQGVGLHGLHVLALASRPGGQSMVAPLSLTMRAQRGRSSRTSVANCSVLLK